jgi:hypothetical protein
LLQDPAARGRARKTCYTPAHSHQNLPQTTRSSPNPAPHQALSGPDTRRACPGVGGSRVGARFWVARDVQNFGFSAACLSRASARPVRVFAKRANGVSVVIFVACSRRVFRALVALAQAIDQQLALRSVEPRHGSLGQGNPGMHSWRRYGAYARSCGARCKREDGANTAPEIKLSVSVLLGQKVADCGLHPEIGGQ